jgi:hypothetical protein
MFLMQFSWGLKRNLMQLHFFFKSTIRKLQITFNMHNGKHTLRSGEEGYGSTDSEDSSTTAPGGRKLYYLPFLVLAASLGTFGYALIK